MGIKGFWQLFEPAAEIQSLVSVAPVHGIRRVAIDIAIWTFQCKTAKGGENPLLRTLFYRLCRLARIGLQVVFVFDGSSRPGTKRGRRVQHIRTWHAVKDLISLFGFTVWQAPGEAEAECAYLQRYGIVDAVITDDVDALMFGAARVYRHWGALDHTSAKSRSHSTHASYFSLKKVTELTGLDTKAMILVALLSGGDYHPAGIPGLGIKTAIEIAKAGYAQSMFRELARLHDWRVSLQRDLHDNAKGEFSSRHPKLAIPESFPDESIVQFYLHPTVSSQSDMLKLAANIIWQPDIQLLALRSFTERFFDWTDLDGGLRFVKSLSHSMLTNRLIAISCAGGSGKSDSDRSTADVGIIEDSCASSLPHLTGLMHIRKVRHHPAADFLTEVLISCDACQLVPLGIQFVTDEATQIQSAVGTTRKHHISSSQQVAPLQSRFWVLQIHLDKAFPSMITTFLSHQLKKKNLEKVQQNILHKNVTQTKGYRQETLDRYFKQSKLSTTKQAIQYSLSPIVSGPGITTRSSNDFLRLNNEQQKAADPPIESFPSAKNWPSMFEDENLHAVLRSQHTMCDHSNSKNELPERTNAIDATVELACLDMQALHMHDTSISNNAPSQSSKKSVKCGDSSKGGHCKLARCKCSKCQSACCQGAVQSTCKISIRQSLGGVWQVASEESHQADDTLRIYDIVETIDLT